MTRPYIIAPGDLVAVCAHVSGKRGEVGYFHPVDPPHRLSRRLGGGLIRHRELCGACHEREGATDEEVTLVGHYVYAAGSVEPVERAVEQGV